MAPRFAASALFVALLSAGPTVLLPGASARADVSSPRTLVSIPTRIWGFAQDGSRIAWLAADAKQCAQRLVVRSLNTGTQVSLASRRSRLCSTNESPAGLALADKRVVYALESGGNTEVDGNVVSVSVSDRRERHAFRYAFEYGQSFPEPGLLLRGDRGTSVVLATGVPLAPEYLGGPCPGCNRLWRIDSRGRARRLMPVGATTTFALGGSRIAIPGERSIQVRDVNGRLIRVIRSGGGGELGLSAEIAVEADASGTLRVYSTKTGRRLWSTQLAGGRVRVIPPLSVAGTRIVYSRGKSIFLADARARRTTLLATAASQPTGLSIEGMRVAWAEDIGAYPHTKSRIRAVELRA